MMKMRGCGLLCGTIFIAAGVVGIAAESTAADDPDIVDSAGFLAQHPDLHWRGAGQKDYQQKRYKEAFEHFHEAARYGDKESQAMVAEMFWNGEGVSQDHPLAYAWMDLAGERGYRDIIVMRERYWNALNENERKRAADVGQAVYAEFGDDVAKPRMEKELLRSRNQITGSHLGHVGHLDVPKIDDSRDPALSLDEGPKTDGSLYFASRYWDPKEYWQWKDQEWKKNHEGQVEVGPLQNAGK